MARKMLLEYFYWNRQERFMLDQVATWLGIRKSIIRTEIARWVREGKVKVLGGKGRGRGRGRSKRIYVLTRSGKGYLAKKGIVI